MRRLLWSWMVFVAVVSGRVWASQDASQFDFYSPIKYSTENAYLFKMHNLQNGVTTNVDTPGVVAYTGLDVAGTSLFYGGISAFKGQNGNNWMYATLNWGGWNYTDDGSSVIRLYEDTGSGFAMRQQVYSEAKSPGGNPPGDRILTGITRANLDNNGHDDFIVGIKYANEQQYFNWMEADGSGNLSIRGGLGTMAGWPGDSSWTTYGMKSGNWTGVQTYQGKSVVTELLLTGEYLRGTTTDGTYLFHKYVVSNGDGTFSILDHNSVYLAKWSPSPVWYGVTVLGSANDPQHPDGEGWLDIVLSTNYMTENSYYSRAYYNPNFSGSENISSGNTTDWNWQPGILQDANPRDFSDIDALLVPEPLTLGLLLPGLLLLRRRSV